jgi:hypothetical protein
VQAVADGSDTYRLRLWVRVLVGIVVGEVRGRSEGGGGSDSWPDGAAGVAPQRRAVAGGAVGSRRDTWWPTSEVAHHPSCVRTIL